MATTWSTEVQMMTLAGVAGTAFAPRPSGETLADQQARILKGINWLIGSGTAAFGWNAIWCALSQDRANLVYIAEDADGNLAVVFRGTITGSPIDTLEDMNVGTMLPFAPASSTSGMISAGAMEAFTEVMNATNAEPNGNSLLQVLWNLLIRNDQSINIYVTGHSLGGAIATTVALFLSTFAWAVPANKPTLYVYTFAAPTAGDANFAKAFDDAFPAGSAFMGIWNQYDAVPNAWWNLVKGSGITPVDEFFPSTHGQPGPSANGVVTGLVKNYAGDVGSYVYVQPTLQAALNQDYSLFSPQIPSGSSLTQCWIDEVVYQHANNTYLQLIDSTAPQIPNLIPVVSGLVPSNGLTINPTPVLVNGSNFTDDCVVDFGTLPGWQPTYVSDTQLSVVAPPGVGIVPVTVTNRYGTSEVTLPVPCTSTSPAPNPGDFCTFTYTPV